MARSVVTEDRAWKEASSIMLHVGLDLSRKRLDICAISDQGELVDELAAPFDEEGLCRLSERMAEKHGGRVRAVVGVDEWRALRARHARGAGVGRTCR